jgi:deoxyribose-phosphate aldolase
LCHKARFPVRQDMEKKLGLPKKLMTGAVCVYSARVADAVKSLEGTGVPVAAVATGFPAGQTLLAPKLAEIRGAVKDGAAEIDIVISRKYAICGEWEELYNEVKAFREACGEAHMKTILATGELPTLRHVYMASLVCMMAGADFIKTSTGMEKVNATLPVSFVMARAIREYYERTGYKIGFKPAGGVRTSKQATAYIVMMMEELGEEWTHPHLFRIGASALLTDIERQIWYHLTNQYGAERYMPMS